MTASVRNAVGVVGCVSAVVICCVGDFGGGAIYMAMGVLAGIINARQTGKGQVVDC